MRYSELLLKLYDNVLKLKKESDRNYIPSDLFICLKELLYLENICDEYYNMIKVLNSSEIKRFKEFAALNERARKKLKEEYKKAYSNGKIISAFLYEYKNISDYIAVAFLNELSEEPFSVNFVKLFNKNIRNIYIESPNTIKRLRIFSGKYRSLGEKNENIGKIFKSLFKEFELLSKINDVCGLKLYDLYNEILRINNSLVSIVSENIPICKEIGSMSNLTDIFLKLENSDDFFSNKYTPLFLDITSQKSVFEYIIENNENLLIIGSFLNKLTDKEFLDSVTTDDFHLNTDKVYDIMNVLRNKGVMKNEKKHSIYSLYNYYKIIDDTFEESKKGIQKFKSKS